MAKGSVRKKGKKWYYRFYVEDASGNRVQKEFPGTESKSETESLLRKAMEDYESKQFLAQAKNITLGDMLDMWVEEELKPGSLSNGTVTAYEGTVSRIKKHPIGKRKLKTIKAEHLQDYMDFLSFGGTNDDGTTAKPLSVGSMRQYSAVLHNSFRFAVFPKQLITFNPMQYVVRRSNDEDYEMFAEDAEGEPLNETPTIDYQQYSELIELLKEKGNPALLPIQIAYFTGLRIGEACSLTWQDINLNEQCLTVRRSMRYNATRKKTEIGPTKRKKIRTVDLCNKILMQKLLLTYPKNPQCNTRNYPFARRRSMSSGQDPVSDERNPVNGGIRPYRIADHIDGHISLSGWVIRIQGIFFNSAISIISRRPSVFRLEISIYIRLSARISLL